MSRHDSAFSDVKAGSAYSAIIKRDGDWWIGWIEEIPGINCQEKTEAVLVESLQEALREVLEINRQDARAAAAGEYHEVAISV